MKLKLKILLLSVLLLSGCSSLRILWESGQEGENTICLNFDDGPNGIATKKLIDVLVKQQVPATFFIIGKNAEREPELLRELSLKGFKIGNHSYEHDTFLFTKNQKTIEADIIKTNNIIKDITGETPSLFRPPNGVINKNIEKACKDISMTPVGVNIFVNDPMLTNADVTYTYVMQELKSGMSTLVLHDGFGLFENPHRVFISDAVDRIINKLKEKGYKFGTINEKGLCS